MKIHAFPMRTVRGAVLAFVLAAVAPALSAASPQRAYATPQAAVEGLFDAVVSGDGRELVPLFGADARRLAPIADEDAMGRVRDRFVGAWSRGHSIESLGTGRARLSVGDAGWTYPVPIVQGADGRWRWDTGAGLREIAVRRVGRNELAAISAMRAYVFAQHEYAQADRDGDGVAEYARRLDSRPGRRDGLHWDDTGGAPRSPLGPGLAVTAERIQGGEPYHGYRFRILEAQGPAARGGARDYRVGGRLTGGFGAIATPAQYGRTGVHTFIVNHDGRVYSSDLGPSTAAKAARIERFDPGPGWKPEN
jgi:hypothetical protein